LPTGRTIRGADMPLITPAADAYHAHAAVTMPTQPPQCIQLEFVWPWASSKLPIASRISVISSVRKTMKTAPLTRVDQSSMYVLKIANATRNHATAFGRFAPARAAAKLFESTARVTKIPSDIQKPPY